MVGGSRVRFRYHVEGKEFVGKRVFFGDSLNSTASVIERRISKYPKGMEVSVFYDPIHPRSAVLEPGLKGADWVAGTIIPMMFGIIGVAFLVL